MNLSIQDVHKFDEIKLTQDPGHSYFENKQIVIYLCDEQNCHMGVSL